MKSDKLTWPLSVLLLIFMGIWSAIILVCYTSPLHAETTAEALLSQSNPAADYCLSQNGKLRKVETEDEWIDVCELMDEQLIEHWLFYYRRQHSF
ncbi:DUF333 domain-containing protein [Shewanella waksmanii]|uniref:DUF333 domain-containing protein n=1 Tax=Shewanella waksmanii TaxID=213783 RepID=UPI003734C8AD